MFNLSFKQQVRTGFAVSLLFVLFSAVTSYFSIVKLNEDTKWQSHTYDVIALVKDIDVRVLNSETGVRGFILSQKSPLLASYNLSANKILPTIQSLRNLVSDNPPQLKRVDSLEFFARQKLANMDVIIRTNAQQGQNAAISEISKGVGQRIKDDMWRISTQITDLEQKLLLKRKASLISSTRQSELVVILTAVIIFALILYLFSFIKRTFDEQKKTEEQIRDSNLELENLSAQNEEKNWILTGTGNINEAMSGEQEIDELTAKIITEICNYIQAPLGAIFLANSSKTAYQFSGGYAYKRTSNLAQTYKSGEGLVGQVALAKTSKTLESIPSDYIKITSGLGDTPPTAIFLIPIIFEHQTLAVIELGLQKKLSEAQSLFLHTIAESIAVGINSAVARVQLRNLFERTQQQAEELESQQEELRTTNEELIFKSEQLQASEEELRVQQEELRETNAELEEKAQQLEERNLLVNQAREAMSLKAEELEISSKYKSEFLANMSHELRTPLNSILILARILKENRTENLNDDQIKYAGVIHNAGSDLLTLINDILDLSKIESGKIDLTIESLKPKVIKQNMEELFAELAKSKKITYEAKLDPDLPEFIITDQARLEQIIKNLLSNAFKFTPEHGNITLKISKASDGTLLNSEQLRNTKSQVLAISVTDSGIGIPEDKQKLIFEAFQQADGSTSRTYGGTGLGLSISKELANILGGEIQLQSKANEGSCFTLFIPQTNNASYSETSIEEAKDFIANQHTPVVPKLPENKTDSVQTLLIVEDDLVFADVLKEYAIEKGFKPLMAHSGDVALEMAISSIPDAIVLDVMLPVMDGWAILKKLKANPLTKHIPVHMMSAGNEKVEKAKQEGAIGFLKKPMEKEQLDQAFDLLSAEHLKYNLNTVLVIEDQELQSKVLTEQLTQKGVEVKQAFTGKEALDLLKDHSFDCIILDLKLPDISGFDLLDQIKSQPALKHVPVIINTAMELDQDKMAHIMKYTEAMVLKSNKSNDRLMDEVSLFINKLKQANQLPAPIHVTKGGGTSSIEKTLKGKTILITDDDMRNIFALSSALQVYDINIVIANTGKQALEKLADAAQIDLVLMDIMMPEMDGYEAMKAIRLDKQFAKLPIIALTAKAMKNDREKCIASGANDYITKPVDIDKLLSMLRVWLS